MTTDRRWFLSFLPYSDCRSFLEVCWFVVKYGWLSPHFIVFLLSLLMSRKHVNLMAMIHYDLLCSWKNLIHRCSVLLLLPASIGWNGGILSCLKMRYGIVRLLLDRPRFARGRSLCLDLWSNVLFLCFLGCCCCRPHHDCKGVQIWSLVGKLGHFRIEGARGLDLRRQFSLFWLRRIFLLLLYLWLSLIFTCYGLIFHDYLSNQQPFSAVFWRKR